MEISEDRIYEAFGLERPDEENTVTQETDSQPETETEIETAAEENFEAEPEDNPAEEPEEVTEEPKEQTLQERRENAARRRKAEQQAAIDMAVQDALQAEREKNDKSMQDFFARAGLKNTISGEAITSMEEFNSWQQAYGRQKLERELEQGKLSPESLETAISQHPLMQQAQEIIDRNNEETRRQETGAAQMQVDRELEEIGRLDPNIKSVEDLLKMPNAQDFYEAVSRGNSFLDAYKLVNFDTLANRRAAAAKQQALNNARSKNHLSTHARMQGEGAVSVPRDEMRIFRQLNPHATDAEIQRYYQKYKA